MKFQGTPPDNTNGQEVIDWFLKRKYKATGIVTDDDDVVILYKAPGQPTWKPLYLGEEIFIPLKKKRKKKKGSA